MLELLFALLGFFFPNQNTNTISNNQQQIIQTSTDFVDGDTNGETGNTPPKK
ncbi:hypothetical protein [Empedobacter tilapiae]|uniref:hypothetical protein n=1 Tax=Empedobacter tilapiae TaxID=2491114 RepID=UPI001456E55D|nr:hypothetical protein [Empedobacter tilapiae]